MWKALLSFAFGGLVVFVPQGDKRPEKRPVKARVVERLEEIVPEVVVEKVLLQDVTKEKACEEVEECDESSPEAIEVEMRMLQQGGLGEKATVQARKLMVRLDKFKTQLDSLHKADKDLDLALGKVKGAAKRFDGERGGEADRQALRDRADRLLEEKARLAELRDRLLVQFTTAQKEIAKVKAKASIDVNRRKALAKIRQNADKAESTVQRNSELARKKIDDSYIALKAGEFTRYLELNKLKAELEAKAAALETYKRLQGSRTGIVKEWPGSTQDRKEIARLEKEIMRMTGELARLKTSQDHSIGVGRGSGGASRSRTSRFGVTRAPRAPRASRSRSSAALVTQSSGRRRAPSTLGAEGKVIWNELQGIRAEIRALRKLLEVHIKTEGSHDRKGSAPRGSVGFFPTPPKARSGVTNTQVERLFVPGKVLGTKDGSYFTVEPGMRMLIKDGRIVISGPSGDAVLDLDTMKALSKKDLLRYLHPLPPTVPAVPQAPRFPSRAEPLRKHKAPKADKRKDKGNKRRRSVVYWGKSERAPGTRLREQDGLQRL